jgi:hypothetical protein
MTRAQVCAELLRLRAAFRPFRVRVADGRTWDVTDREAFILLVSSDESALAIEYDRDGSRALAAVRLEDVAEIVLLPAAAGG